MFRTYNQDNQGGNHTEGEIIMTIIYVHGLGSGANSRTGRNLKDIFPSDNILCPEMPIMPKDAITYLTEYCKEHRPDIVIGTSLGGFYSMFPCGPYRILVNPAIDADNIIRDRIGMGKHDYFCSRLDGASEYVIDEAVINQLAGAKEYFFSTCFDYEHKAQTFAIFGDKDDLCDCRELYRSYYDLCDSHCIIAPDMEHRLSIDDINKYIVPLVEKIRKEKVQAQ